jgi:DNA mismatch repair protein MutS2
LRSAVQQHLKRDSRVQSFRLGNYGEGDSGVTFADLK